ncbi:MAG: hypothetical protein DRJ40_09145 [Thermoprotei archaeon]|nr:MAG: hypothetical protein DRJ40_09145 [Thermoprotei archaeon]
MTSNVQDKELKQKLIDVLLKKYRETGNTTLHLELGTLSRELGIASTYNVLAALIDLYLEDLIDIDRLPTTKSRELEDIVLSKYAELTAKQLLGEISTNEYEGKKRRLIDLVKKLHQTTLLNVLSKTIENYISSIFIDLHSLVTKLKKLSNFRKEGRVSETAYKRLSSEYLAKLSSLTTCCSLATMLLVEVAKQFEELLKGKVEDLEVLETKLEIGDVEVEEYVAKKREILSDISKLNTLVADALTKLGLSIPLTKLKIDLVPGEVGSVPIPSNVKAKIESIEEEIRRLDDEIELLRARILIEERPELQNELATLLARREELEKYLKQLKEETTSLEITVLSAERCRTETTALINKLRTCIEDSLNITTDLNEEVRRIVIEVCKKAEELLNTLEKFTMSLLEMSSLVHRLESREEKGD